MAHLLSTIFIVAGISIQSAFAFTLASALSYAEAHAPELAKYRYAVSIASLERKNSQATLLPTLDLQTAHGIWHNSDVGSGGDASSYVSLLLSETIYDNGQRWLQRQQAGLQYSVDQLKFLDARENLALDLSHTYLDYSLQTQLYKIEQDRLAQLKKRYQDALEQYQQGLRLQQDVVRFANQARRAELRLIKIETTIEQARQTLFAKLGITPSTQAKTTFTPLILKNYKPETGLTPLDWQQQYQYQINQQQTELNNLTVKRVKRDNGLDVRLTAGVDYKVGRRPESLNIISRDDRLNWRVALQINLPIWDWGIRSRNIAIAQQAQLQQQTDLEQISLVVQREMQQLLIATKHQQQSYALSEKLLKSEQENYHLLEQDYREGKLAYLDLITGLENLANANSQYVTDLYQLQKSQYRYHFYKGNLYAHLVA